MLRRAILSLSQNRRLREWIQNSGFARPLTSRFIAGQSLSDGIVVLGQLWGERILGSLDFLGENVRSLTEATKSKESYLQALREIDRSALPATISVKLTQLGLDFSDEGCASNVAELLRVATRLGTRVEVDMESTEYTDRTLSIVRGLQEQFPGHVRSVIQAYLYRSEDDIRALNAARIPVRLCKGAYQEPASKAFPRKADVDANYCKLMELLFENGTEPAIASHDEHIVRSAVRRVREREIAPSAVEFQMLYGIRRDLQHELVRDGFRLRLYVPYGEAWYPYFMRRLAERPANLLFLVRNLLHR
jgi:proline dehydrogenase